MGDIITVTWNDDIATLTVNRPGQLNALNSETLSTIREALVAIERDARAVIVTGAGEDAFVAGADIAEMVDMDAAEAHAYCELGQEVMIALESFPAPVIAAINGYALGGGCELALACDFRIASDRTLIARSEIDLGIIPAWGGTQRLVEVAGDRTARRLIFLGERIDAEKAYACGLVDEVVDHADLDDRVNELAADLAAKPRSALAAAKEAINQAHETSHSAGLRFERRTWSSLFDTEDQSEGMEAFLEDRDPDFI
jgi:enoyl-CoA hydratase/carnithine racemase